MAAWPGEQIEECAGEIAAAGSVLLSQQAGWRHRRVETITVLSHEQVRRQVSVDFTVPEEYRESLRLPGHDEHAVPLAFLVKRPLVHFDLRNEEGHSIPLLTADQTRMIGRELLFQTLETDLAAQDVDTDAVALAAEPLVEAVLADDERQLDDRIDELESQHDLEPLIDFRAMAGLLSRFFIVWAVVRGVDRRRIFKFAHDHRFAQLPGWTHAYETPGVTEAWSYHVEVAVPPDLRARTTTLGDSASEAVIAMGERNSDRPAIYYSAAPTERLVRPSLRVAYGAERWRFLAPAAIVAAVIALLVVPPLLFADLPSLAESAAIGIVLSTSAVFSALVLRTDEHPLLRLMLVRYRLCLVACTLAALFAAAALGFQARSWVVYTTWSLAGLVSAIAAGILIVEAIRAPSVRSSPGAQP